MTLSVFQLGFDELAVEAGDVAQRNVLGAFGSAGTGVGAVAEPEFVHLADHGAGAAGALNLTLGKKCELAHLGADKQHCRTVLASCHTGTATDAGCRVHSLVGNLLRDGEVVGIGGTAAVERHVTACLLDLVERVTVDHEVANHRERSRTPRFDSDFFLVMEFAHVELACRDALHGAVGMAVDIERAHAADTLAAVVVEHHGFLTLVDELLVEHVEHLEERAAGRHVLYTVFDELARFFGTTLTPNLQIYIYCMFHN